MKPLYHAGFTIIETMLFLGITGLLIMGVLVGAGTSINIQRYRDSVSSLQSTLQQQYSNVFNVSNDSQVNDCGASTNQMRGQSDCVILGRFITSTNSRRLVIKDVIGTIPAGSTSSLNDVNIFLKDGNGAQSGYDIKVLDTHSEIFDIEWGASLVDVSANNGVALNFSMLILRSPVSGAVRTFISPDSVVADRDIATLVNQSALTKPIKVCVNSNGLFTGGRSAVSVAANATSASGVELLGEALSGC